MHSVSLCEKYNKKFSSTAFAWFWLFSSGQLPQIEYAAMSAVRSVYKNDCSDLFLSASMGSLQRQTRKYQIEKYWFDGWNDAVLCGSKFAWTKYFWGSRLRILYDGHYPSRRQIGYIALAVVWAILHEESESVVQENGSSLSCSHLCGDMRNCGKWRHTGEAMRTINSNHIYFTMTKATHIYTHRQTRVLNRGNRKWYCLEKHHVNETITATE